MLLKYITLASGLNFLFLSIVLLLKKATNRRANTILGIFFIFLSTYGIVVSFRFSSLIDQNYYYLRYYTPIDGIFLLLLGPCLYFYVLSILNKPFRFLNWKIFLHLIPLVPFVLFNIYFASLPYHVRINWLIVDFKDGMLETNLLNIVLYLQIVLYLILCYSLVKKQLKVSDFVIHSDGQVDVS